MNICLILIEAARTMFNVFGIVLGVCVVVMVYRICKEEIRRGRQAILDIKKTKTTYRRTGNTFTKEDVEAFEKDRKAIEGDWKQVGQDMYSAIDQFEKEKNLGKYKK